MEEREALACKGHLQGEGCLILYHFKGQFPEKPSEERKMIQLKAGDANGCGERCCSCTFYLILQKGKVYYTF